MVLALILLIAAFAILLRLMFGLAVFALPVAVGGGAALMAHATGAGVFGASLVGLCAGTLVLGVGQAVFGLASSPLARLAVGAIYAVPAAALGFGLAYGVLGIGVDAEAWRVALSLIGAAVTGAAAFQRVSALALPPEGGEAEEGSAGAGVDAPSTERRWSARPRRRVRDGRTVARSTHRP
jgi:hypothetical protein